MRPRFCLRLYKVLQRKLCRTGSALLLTMDPTIAPGKLRKGTAGLTRGSVASANHAAVPQPPETEDLPRRRPLRDMSPLWTATMFGFRVLCRYCATSSNGIQRLLGHTDWLNLSTRMVVRGMKESFPSLAGLVWDYASGKLSSGPFQSPRASQPFWSATASFLKDFYLCANRISTMQAVLT